MQGSPLFRTALVVAVLLLLLFPLMHLTKAPTATQAATSLPPEVNKTRKIHLQLASTRLPLHFELIHLGRTIWSGEATENEIQKEIEIKFPKEGIDLELKGRWNGGNALGAVKLTVTPDSAEPIEKTVWAKEDFDEVLTFQ
jgi:hypothetical protein